MAATLESNQSKADLGSQRSLNIIQGTAAISSAVYNANNQLTQWGSTQMTYDLNGNTLNDGTNAYVWDARNRLVSANSGGATYAYDPLGRRVSKTLLSTATNFLYDGPNPVQELNGTTPTANLLTGGVDERFQRTDATGAYSYLTDALGSTMALTDSTGAQQATYSYGPYGSMSISGSTTNSYGYTGRESDGLGIDYYRARYYNPAIGRFISEDPMGFAGSGPDLYQYAGDDPIDFNDPFGLDRGSGGGGGGGNGSGGGNGGLLHRVGCGVAGQMLQIPIALAQATGGTAGLGIGGSAAAGKWSQGFAINLGLQAVTDAQGNLGIAYTSGGAFPFGGIVVGVGAAGGAQFSLSNAHIISKLEGPVVDGSISYGEGYGGSVDLSDGLALNSQGQITGLNGVYTGTVTLPFAVGGKGFVGTLEETQVISITNCSDVW